MKIGISGAQSVGKTTLLNAIRSEPFFKGFEICNEVTRRVKSYGFSINENGNDVTQRLIMQEHVINIFMYSDFITDRTVLDGLVYSKYLRNHSKISNETMDFVYKVYSRCIGQYDLLFYIPPEFELEDDGVRSIDVTFRNSIVESFENVIYTHGLTVTILKGSLRERLDTVIESYEKARSRRMVNE